VGLFLGCVSCHSSAEVFFLLNFLVVESGCEVFGLEDLANLYVGVAYVENRTALDPLDGLFERLDLPEPEAGDEFLAFGEGAVGDGAVLAGEVDASAFGGGVKTVEPNKTPASKSSPLNLFMSAMSWGSWGTPSFSVPFVALTMTMNRILFVLLG
jgi:hypothetical protein